MYQIVYSKRAVKDIKNLQSAGLDKNAKELIKLIKNNPFQAPPTFEKLQGNLLGMYSRRINIQHRIIYEVFKDEKIIKIIRMWTHYER